MKIVPGDLLLHFNHHDSLRELPLYFVVAVTEFDVFYVNHHDFEHLDRCERSNFHKWAKNYTERLNERS